MEVFFFLIQKRINMFARPRGSAYKRLCLSVGLSVPLFLPQPAGGVWHNQGVLVLFE